jgi:tetratricopeptide (TPR) repeat protein
MAIHRLHLVAIALAVAAGVAAVPSQAATAPRRGAARGREGAAARGRQAGRRPAAGAQSVVPAHPGPVDPEVDKALAAFSAGDYAKARALGEAMLKKPNRGSRHDEAVDVIVESWLAEGDFTRARAAAKQYAKQAPTASKEALARVNAQEKDYRADLAELQRRKQKAKKPEQAAHLQLLIGHTHRRVGRAALAEQAYREVIARYPKTRAAGMAKRQLASMRKSEKKAKGK